MKWVVHTGNPTVSEQGINDIFRADPRKDDAVLVTPNVDSALTLVGDAMSGDWHDSCLAALMGPRSTMTMQLPTCPIRNSVSKFLRKAQADHRGSMMAVAVRFVSFSHGALSDGMPLTGRLAQGAGLGDPIVPANGGRGPKQQASSQNVHADGTKFDSFLELNYGARKVGLPDVEVRSVGEYDRLVDALFRSSSFREAAANITLLVIVSGRDLTAQPGAQVVAENLFYHLADKHLDDFSESVLPTTRDHGTRLAVGMATLHSSAQVLQYGDVAQRSWDLLFPARQWNQARRGGPRNPNYSAGGAAEYVDSGRNVGMGHNLTQATQHQQYQQPEFLSPTTQQHRGILAEEIALLEQRKVILQNDVVRQRRAQEKKKTQDLPQLAEDEETTGFGTAYGAQSGGGFTDLSPTRKVEAARRDLVDLGRQHDDLERKFATMAQRLTEEKEVMKTTEGRLKHTNERLLKERPRRDHLLEEKAKLAAEASALSLDRDRLFRELHVKEEHALERERTMKEVETDFQIAKNEELRREEEGLNKAREQSSSTLEQSRRAVENAAVDLQNDQERKLRVLEERRKNAHLKVEDEVSRRDEASRKAVALKTKFMGLQQEVATLERALQAVQQKEAELRNPVTRQGEFSATPALLSHDAQLRLQLQQSALEGTLTGLVQERTSLKQVIQEMEAHTVRQEQLVTQAESKTKDAFSTLFARFRTQMDTMARVLIDHEGARRDVIEQEALLEWDQLAQAEVANWDGALYQGEKFFHEGTHLEQRTESIRLNKECTETLHRAATLLQQSEDYRMKFTICDQGHTELMADCQRQLTSLTEEDTQLRDTIGADGSVLAKLVEEQESLKGRCETLRACLAQAPIEASRNRAGGVVAIKYSGVLPTAGELIDRLTQLYTSADGKLDVHQLEAVSGERKVKRLEREVEERTNILKRVRGSVAEAESDIQKLEDSVAERKLAVEERTHNHAILRQQLKDEYVRAQETMARHRVEAGQELQALSQQEAQLEETLHRTERELVTLRQQRGDLRMRNVSSNEASVRIEIQRELVKQKQLRNEINTLSQMENL